MFILLNAGILLNGDSESRIETAASHFWWIEAASLYATVIRQHCWCYFLPGDVRVAVCWLHFYRNGKHSSHVAVKYAWPRRSWTYYSVILFVNNRCVHLKSEVTVRH